MRVAKVTITANNKAIIVNGRVNVLCVEFDVSIYICVCVKVSEQNREKEIYKTRFGRPVNSN